MVTLFGGVRNMKFVGVKQFKQDALKYLNEGNEIVAMNRKKPIGLSDFAFYSGVGAKATMNLGMAGRI
jgi:CRISPR/Cas system endoribonuclease Cas6 (RAMP superfamily)